MIAEDSESPYRLLIIDSIMALYRVDYSGRGELAYVSLSLSLSPSPKTNSHNIQRETTKTCPTFERIEKDRIEYETCRGRHESSHC